MGRAGTYVKQPEGYSAFVPKELPPDPPVSWDSELKSLLSQADRALGRLDGVASFLPNPNLFVAMYVRKEAVLSSQIEGTQASLLDVLDYETTGEMVKDVDEIVNYVNAMNKGLELLKDIPISLRLIRNIHSVLLDGVRGENRMPGEFRNSQNWIGHIGGNIDDAVFVPPAPHEMRKALGELENFIHQNNEYPVLIKNALIHAQFETIHPFLDGNGRVGRLLVTFLLMHEDILQKPLLYLSYYLKKHRQSYYDLLNKVRIEGDWESWIKFFVKGVYVVSKQATDTAKRIVSLQSRDRNRLSGDGKALALLEHLFYQPMVTTTRISELLGVSASTANRIVSFLEQEEILVETTGYVRNRKFIYRDYIDILREGTDIIS